MQNKISSPQRAQSTQRKKEKISPFSSVVSVLSVVAFFLLAGCGYHLANSEQTSVSVPYVTGDHEGTLTAALIRQIAESPDFIYARECGELILNVRILSVDDERIGLRYDRSPSSDKRRSNLVAVENRHKMTAEVTLYQGSTEEIIMGPEVVTADVDFDYVDQNSPQDLTVRLPGGKHVSSVGFSLGQLDSVDAAKIDALQPLYRALAQKIVNGLIVYCNEED